ncbi:MAG: hypothetical protein HY913_16175 [Desulfomonile tiedjei]|nr:hypothetical protein [Desulfomonile tiedjei]
MKHRLVLWRIALLSVAALLGSTSYVHSQDLFRDMDQVKRDLTELKNEVNQLRTLVYSLREAVLKSVTSQDQGQPEKARPKEEKAAKSEIPADDKEITREVCPVVGKFFTEVDAALKASDDSAAEARMREASRKMNASLAKYAGTHRVSKLLTIYEGLAWDTYVAVELRGSIQGNQEFIEALNRHKRKYRETCVGN